MHSGHTKDNGAMRHSGHGMKSWIMARLEEEEVPASELLAPSSASPAPRPVDSGVGIGRFSSLVGTSVMNAIGFKNYGETN